VHRRLKLLVLLTALMASSCVLALASTRHPTLQLRRTSIGTILVDASGYTLYAFSKDGRNHDVCAREIACLAVWPALVSSHPTAGAGVKRRLIGTIRVTGVGRQVTYAGHPLYTYDGDDQPGETAYVNTFQSGGYWPALDAAGHEVK